MRRALFDMPPVSQPSREWPRSRTHRSMRSIPTRLRAWSCLLIFLLSLVMVSELSTLALRGAGYNSRWESRLMAHGLGWWLTHTKALAFLIVVLATWIVANFEHKSVGDFGLPWHRAFRGRFWLGAACGFAALTFLLAAMHMIGVFNFAVVPVHGIQPWERALSYALVFVFGALFEESLFRGYLQSNLTSAVGFWPAAAVTSLLFAYAHRNNSDETFAGVLSAGAVGFLFCLLLRRNGDLWVPVGFHAAWNWGETYFYGVPNSGAASSTHLFQGNFSGPPWLTGGSAGPEGSWLCLILIATSCMAVAHWLRKASRADPPALETDR